MERDKCVNRLDLCNTAASPDRPLRTLSCGPNLGACRPQPEADPGELQFWNETEGPVPWRGGTAGLWPGVPVLSCGTSMLSLPVASGPWMPAPRRLPSVSGPLRILDRPRCWRSWSHHQLLLRHTRSTGWPAAPGPPGSRRLCRGHHGSPVALSRLPSCSRLTNINAKGPRLTSPFTRPRQDDGFLALGGAEVQKGPSFVPSRVLSTAATPTKPQQLKRLNQAPSSLSPSPAPSVEGGPLAFL